MPCVCGAVPVRGCSREPHRGAASVGVDGRLLEFMMLPAPASQAWSMRPERGSGSGPDRDASSVAFPGPALHAACRGREAGWSVSEGQGVTRKQACRRQEPRATVAMAHCLLPHLLGLTTTRCSLLHPLLHSTRVGGASRWRAGTPHATAIEAAGEATAGQGVVTAAPT